MEASVLVVGYDAGGDGGKGSFSCGWEVVGAGVEAEDVGVGGIGLGEIFGGFLSVDMIFPHTELGAKEQRAGS